MSLLSKEIIFVCKLCIFSLFSVHVSNEFYLSENLEKLGANALTVENESDIGKCHL